MSSAEGGKERNLSSFVPEIEFRLPSFLPSFPLFVCWGVRKLEHQKDAPLSR